MLEKVFQYQQLFSRFMTAILHEKVGQRILCLLIINILSTVVLFYHCFYTNSMALTSFSYLSIFNSLRLCNCFVSIWVRRQKPNYKFSFGFERFEVLSVFICTTVTQLCAFFIFKESFERLIQQDKVLAETQISMVILGSLVNILITYGVYNKPFDLVSRGAPSNWIQDALFDFGKSICGILPLLSRFLLVRMNPYMLLSHTAALTVVLESILIEYKGAYDADTVAAMFIAVLVCVTMYPLSVHCGMILMQTIPKDLMASIDKCLKEANTLDGLLEFRQEHFWTISFGKYAGSMHVRIRRDANEQLILAQLTNKLSPYLHHITIQIFKDDWKEPVTSSIRNHVYEPRASLPYVSSVAKANSKELTKNNPSARYPLNYQNNLSVQYPLNYQNTMASKNIPNSQKENMKSYKYTGPKN